MEMKILLLLLVNLLATVLAGSSSDVRAEVGTNVVLPCRVDTAQCGDLHSVKWYRDNQRVYVFSHVAGIARPEGDGSDRMDVQYTANDSVSFLHIKDVRIKDEATYKCEKTYMEVRENCDVVQIMKLRTLKKPQSVRILNRDGTAIGNATRFGPFVEGTQIDLECEAAGAKPIPEVAWYNGTTRMRGAYSSEQLPDGTGTARNKIRVTLSRGDLGAEYRCHVESDALDQPMLSWVRVDVHVRPTKIELGGVTGHVVQETNVQLNCNVYGARPPANITWYNGTEPIPSNIVETTSTITRLNTKTVKMADGTYMTQSDLAFAASRYENGQTLICEAENPVIRENKERPMRQRLTLEVLYKPIVSVSPENVTVSEGTDVLFFCSYEANPNKLDFVKWMKDGKVLTLEGNEDHYEGGTVDLPPLKIKNVNPNDIGEYSCILKNSVGAADSNNSAYLNVLYKPTVDLTMDPSNIVKASDRTNVTLLCDVISGNPNSLSRVRWYLGGELLKEIPDENCTNYSPNDVNNDTNFCYLDPSRLLLEYVGKMFAGNYSCRGMNDAGWGPESNQTELIVYYPPSQAIVHFLPSRVIKKASMTLYCHVEDPGRPENTKFHWYRGNRLIQDATTANWTISPVTLETESNFTCVAYNEGGQSAPGTVNVEVLAPPAFIVPLQPYTGALYNSKFINISCRVECSPICSVNWLKDGRPIDNNHRYTISKVVHPPDLRTNDFESIQSILSWNISAWPNEQLDRLYDNANYTCQSSSNGVGPGVTSTTLFAVEYPPENITVSNRIVSVNENHIPERVLCNAKAHPEVSYSWRRENHPDILSKGNALMLGSVTRSAAGNYICEAFNRHGNTTHKTFLNVKYKPECAITQTEHNGSPALVCTAHANPKEVTFTWRVKGMNDTPDDMSSVQQHGLQSYLVLDSGVDSFRTYLCYANNSVGVSIPCERDVAGTIAWWKRIDNDNLLIIIAIIIGIIICVIVICIIIIIVCRRKRANNKYNNPVELEERENAYDLRAYNYNFRPDGQSPEISTPSKWPLKPGVLVHMKQPKFSPLPSTNVEETENTQTTPNSKKGKFLNFGNGNSNSKSKSKERFLRFKEFFGLRDPDALPIGVYEGPSGGPVNQSNITDKDNLGRNSPTDPLNDPETKTFYENLPFHGMQNPPNKPVSVITPFNHNQPNVTKSQQSFNTSTKSLVHSQKSPLLKPIPTRIQRNQSFHGFQGLPPPRFPFGQNFPNAPSFPNLPLGISNQIYQTNPFNSTSSIGPLILSQNSLTLKKSLDTIGQTNLAFSPPKNQYFQPLRFGPSSGAMNPFTPSKGVTHTPPRLPLFNISTFGKSQSNLTSGNLANGSNEGTSSTLKTSQETIAGSLGSSGEQTRVKRARSLKSSQSGSIATTTSNLKASENGYGLSNERLGEPQGNSRDQNQVKRAMSFVASQSGSIGGTPSTLKASQETIGGTRGGSGEQNRVKRARSFVSSQSGSIGGTPSCSQAFQNILKTPQERSENQNQPSPVNRTSSIGTNTLQTSQNAGEGFQIERSRSFSLPGDLEENEPPLGLHKKSRSIPGLVEEIPEVRKFGSLEYRPHKCNSPQFYSVRCKKHGKKRTIFELYTLGPNKSLQKGLQGPAGPPKHCVVVSQIPKTNSNPKDFKDDEIIYQNLTDSIQILEQNSENDYYEFLQKPKPAPRCKKHQNIYQNVSASIQNREFDLNDSTGEENRSNLSLENSAENSNQTLSTGKHFGNSLDTSDSTKKMFEGLKSPGLKDLSNTQKDSSPENSSGDIPSTGKCSGTPFNGSNLSGNGFETTGSPGFLELSCISSINTSRNPLEASGTSIDASLEEKSPNPEKKIKLSPIALEENSNSDQNVDNQKPQSTMQNFFEKGGVLRSTFSKKEASGTPKNLVRDVPENIPGDCQTQNLNSPKPCGNTGNGSNMVPIQKPPRLTLTQFFKTGSTKPFLKSSSNDNKGPERTLILTPKSPLPGPPSLGFFRTEGSARASFSAKNLRASQNKKNENEKNFKEEIGAPNNVHGTPNPNLGNQNLPDSPKSLPGSGNFAPKGAPISPKSVQSFPQKYSPNKNFQGFPGNQNFLSCSKNSLQEGPGSPKRVPIPPKPVQEFQQKFSPNKPFQGFSGIQNVVPGTQNFRSGTQNLRPGTQNVAPENQNLAPGAQNLTSATQKTVPGTQNFVSGTKNVAPGTLNLVPGTQNFVAGTQNLVQGIPKDTNLKYPVPIKPNLNPVPKNPNFENSQNFSNVPKIQGYQGTQGSSQPYRPDLDDMVYADVDGKDYGPINYKAASVYAMMKKNKNTQRLEEYDGLL